jgi:predicted CxxxxCH...CXXCH cytochrome family protein
LTTFPVSTLADDLRVVTAKTVWASEPHQIEEVIFVPAQSRIITRSEDEVRTWDIKTLIHRGPQCRLDHEVNQFGPASSMAVAPDGKFLFIAHARGEVTRWDVRSGKLLGQFQFGEPEQPVACTALACHSDGTLAAAGLDGIIRARAGPQYTTETVIGRDLGIHKLRTICWQEDKRLPVIWLGTMDGRVGYVLRGDTSLRDETIIDLHAKPAHRASVEQLAVQPEGRVTVITRTHISAWMRGASQSRITILAGKGACGLANDTGQILQPDPADLARIRILDPRSLMEVSSIRLDPVFSTSRIAACLNRGRIAVGDSNGQLKLFEFESNP